MFSIICVVLVFVTNPCLAISFKENGTSLNQSQSYCVLPLPPKNGTYTIIKGDTSAKPGQIMQTYELSVACDPGFELVGNDAPSCTEEWASEMPKCIQRCGKVSPAHLNSPSVGHLARKKELPWGAGIYTKRQKPYMQICSGSLVSNTIVITAAHCFWNDVHKALPAANYAVAVGKIYRKWTELRDELAQKSDVQSIHIPPHFQGAAANFQEDLAVVVLSSPFSFTSAVRPVCLDFDEALDMQQLTNGTMGTVGGWGLVGEDGHPSQILQIAYLPYIDFEECYVGFEPSFRPYLSSDKICAGYTDGTAAICKGDSGGGLCFPHKSPSGRRFYLRGVASTAPNNEHICNVFSRTTFTHLQRHRRFIQPLLNANPRPAYVECGTVTPKGEVLVAGGETAYKGELPWHAGIYTKTTNPYKQVCGGSLISTNIVISAAHCFWTGLEQQLPASQFAVAVGKIYRPFDDTHDIYAQKSDVKSIHIPTRFQGSLGNYRDDIALVVVVAPFTYQPFIRPVCLSFEPNFEKQQLQPSNNGTVMGWGLTSEDGKEAPILQVIQLPYVDVDTCVTRSPYEFQAFFTSDKICAGTTEPTSALCKGDSGGGLAFPTSNSGAPRYFLRGIVSSAPKNEHLCNTAVYTSFTKISKHENFIKQFWTDPY